MANKIQLKNGRIGITNADKIRLVSPTGTCCGCPHTVIIDTSALTASFCTGLAIDTCATGHNFVTLTMGSQCDYTGSQCTILSGGLGSNDSTDYHLFWSPSIWQLDIVIHGSISDINVSFVKSDTTANCQPVGAYANISGAGCISGDVNVYLGYDSNCYCADRCGCCDLVIDTVTGGLDGSGCSIDSCNPDGSGGEDITPIRLQKVDVCTFANSNTWCVGGVRVNGTLSWDGTNWLLVLVDAANTGSTVGVFTGGTNPDDPTDSYYNSYVNTTGCFTGGPIYITTCCLPKYITLDTSAVDFTCLVSFGLPDCDSDSIASPFQVNLVIGCPPSGFVYSTGCYSAPYNPFCTSGKKVGVLLQYSNAGYGNQWLLYLPFGGSRTTAVWGGPTDKCDPRGTYTVLPGYCTTGNVMIS